MNSLNYVAVMLEKGKHFPKTKIHKGDIVLRIIKKLLQHNPYADVVPLYESIVKWSRQKVFYEELGVPDTLDGRFEMISLHMFAVLHRLKNENQCETFSQQLFDLFFADMDQCLREMGVGDTGIGTRIKQMAQGFYGRLKSYEESVALEELLLDALRRNVYGTVLTVDQGHLRGIEKYLTKTMNCLEKSDIEDVVSGQIGIEFYDVRQI